MKHKTTCLLLLTAVLLIVWCEEVNCKPVKPLVNTRYSYKILVRRGYKCDKFKGSVFMTYQRYLNLVNNKTVIK